MTLHFPALHSAGRHGSLRASLAGPSCRPPTRDCQRSLLSNMFSFMLYILYYNGIYNNNIKNCHAFMNSTMGIIIISLLLFHKTCLFTPDIESNMPKFRIGAYFLLESMKYSNIQPYAYLHISRYIWSRLSGHGRPDHVVWMTPKRPRSGGES